MAGNLLHFEGFPDPWRDSSLDSSSVGQASFEPLVLEPLASSTTSSKPHKPLVLKQSSSTSSKPPKPLVLKQASESPTSPKPPKPLVLEQSSTTSTKSPKPLVLKQSSTTSSKPPKPLKNTSQPPDESFKSKPIPLSYSYYAHCLSFNLDPKSELQTPTFSLEAKLQAAKGDDKTIVLRLNALTPREIGRFKLITLRAQFHSNNNPVDVRDYTLDERYDEMVIGYDEKTTIGGNLGVDLVASGGGDLQSEHSKRFETKDAVTLRGIQDGDKWMKWTWEENKSDKGKGLQHPVNIWAQIPAKGAALVHFQLLLKFSWSLLKSWKQRGHRHPQEGGSVIVEFSLEP